MNIFQRIWMAVFGPWSYMKQDKQELLLQRGHYGQLLISAQDDCYAVQLRLTSEQADQLQQWLGKTSGSIVNRNRNNVIRFPNKSP